MSLESSSNSELASWQTRRSHASSTSGGKRNPSEASHTAQRDGSSGLSDLVTSPSAAPGTADSGWALQRVPGTGTALGISLPVPLVMVFIPSAQGEQNHA